MDKGLEQIKKFTQVLENGGVPPFDNEQGVIEEIAETHNSSVLPVLRQALGAAIEYQRRAQSEFSRTDPDTVRSGHLHIMQMMAKHMESRLRDAIMKCTPSGETPVFESPPVETPPAQPPAVENIKKWWQFWKK